MDDLFLESCRIGDLSSCLNLIRKNVNINCIDPKTGQNALMKASLNGHSDLVKLLLQKGINPNDTDPHGQNSLHYAIQSKSEKTVKLLCNQEGIDLRKRGKLSGYTPKELSLNTVNFKNEESQDEIDFYPILVRCEKGYLNEISDDDESDNDKGEVYTKSKKGKKKGKKGSGKGKKKAGKGKSKSKKKK